MPRNASLLLLAASALLCAGAALALAAAGGDEGAFRALNAWAAQALPPALPSYLTLLGNGMAAIVLVALWLRRQPGVVLAALLSVPVGSLFSLSKRWVQRPRPAAVLDPATFVTHGQVLAGHTSFPSGHTLTAFALAAVLVCASPAVRARAPLAALALAGAALVGLSRVFVGAHWPSDALGGAALGIVAGASGAWAAARWPLHQRRYGPVILSLLVIVASLVLGYEDTGYPDAAPLQRLLAALGVALGLHALVQDARRRATGPA